MHFATDENLDGRILSGLLIRLPNLDIVRVQDTPLYQAADPDLLAWLAEENRILLTHDLKTIPSFVADRVNAGLSMPGVIFVKRRTPIGLAVEHLEIMIEASTPDEFENQVRYIPLP
jgi:hypothetical protein